MAQIALVVEDFDKDKGRVIQEIRDVVPVSIADILKAVGWHALSKGVASVAGGWKPASVSPLWGFGVGWCFRGRGLTPPG